MLASLAIGSGLTIGSDSAHNSSWLKGYMAGLCSIGTAANLHPMAIFVHLAPQP